MHEGPDAAPTGDRRPATSGDGRAAVSPTLIAFVAIGIVAVVFVLQNSRSTQIEFLWLDVKAPLWVTLALTIVVGIVLDRLLSLWLRRRRRNGG